MKGNLKEIVARLKSETTLEEIISYCDTIDDFNKIFDEYCKVHEVFKHKQEIVDCILASYDDVDAGFAPKIAEMIIRYERYTNGKPFALKDGEIILNEQAASRTSVECGFSGTYLREFIRVCALKGVLK